MTVHRTVVIPWLSLAVKLLRLILLVAAVLCAVNLYVVTAQMPSNRARYKGTTAILFYHYLSPACTQCFIVTFWERCQ